MGTTHSDHGTYVLPYDDYLAQHSTDQNTCHAHSKVEECHAPCAWFPHASTKCQLAGPLDRAKRDWHSHTWSDSLLTASADYPYALVTGTAQQGNISGETVYRKFYTPSLLDPSAGLWSKSSGGDITLKGMSAPTGIDDNVHVLTTGDSVDTPNTFNVVTNSNCQTGQTVFEGCETIDFQRPPMVSPVKAADMYCRTIIPRMISGAETSTGASKACYLKNSSALAGMGYTANAHHFAPTGVFTESFCTSNKSGSSLEDRRSCFQVNGNRSTQDQCNTKTNCQWVKANPFDRTQGYLDPDTNGVPDDGSTTDTIFRSDPCNYYNNQSSQSISWGETNGPYQTGMVKQRTAPCTQKTGSPAPSVPCETHSDEPSCTSDASCKWNAGNGWTSTTTSPSLCSAFISDQTECENHYFECEWTGDTCQNRQCKWTTCLPSEDHPDKCMSTAENLLNETTDPFVWTMEHDILNAGNTNAPNGFPSWSSSGAVVKPLAMPGTSGGPLICQTTERDGSRAHTVDGLNGIPFCTLPSSTS